MLTTRILTGLALAVVVLATILLLDTTAASLVFALFWLIGAHEWARLAELGSAGRAVYAAGFAALVVLVMIADLPLAALEIWLWLAVACWLIAFVLVLRYPQPLARGPIAAAGLVVLSAAWLAFYRLHGAGGTGPGLVLAGLAIIWAADIGAFFVGRSLGRRLLAPTVSPKKTWEGVAGGVVAAVLTAAATALMLDLPVGVIAPLAGGVALVSVVGDLGVSMLKRRIGLKDSGMLLPGHGGVLDRFDGVTAALPVLVLGLQFAHVLD